MILTIFYMMATWIQAWRLATLKARLATSLAGPEAARPTLMFLAKSMSDSRKEYNGAKVASNSESANVLSSHLCKNQSVARLGDLIWCHGDKKLCTIYPQQKIDVKDWLIFPTGKTQFPLHVRNHGKALLNDSTKMHALIEADVENYHPTAFAKATRLEDYGKIVTWTFDENFAVILETDLDHMTKLSIALMHGKCFINNGFTLTRVESIGVTGKPCVYNSEELVTLHHDKKLIGKAQWDAHVKILKTFSSIARHVAQQGVSLEIDEVPGVHVSPGNQPINLHIPTILEIQLPRDASDDAIAPLDDIVIPSTPPPTPATIIPDKNGSSKPSTVETLLSSVPSSKYLETSRTEDLTKILEVMSPEVTKDSADSVESPNKTTKTTSTASSVQTPQRNFSTKTSHYSPSKRPMANFCNTVKPPNVLIYADSTIAAENIKNVLGLTLNKDKYIVYTLSSDEAKKDVWMDQTVLVIVCGNVGAEISSQLVEYMVRGGQLLALCSDTLHTLLPSFKTAEVREHELVRFSYGKWKHVQMMHHIFCYQASPVKTQFSQDHDESRTKTPHTPVSANVYDSAGKLHTFHVKVLGTEETWHTPSILLANLPESGGRAVFSQIHLEADPSQYEMEETKFNALKQSNTARLEILSDLLTTHFGLDARTGPRDEVKYTPGFFLGRHELKLDMLDRLKDKTSTDDIYKTDKMSLQFCGRTTKPIAASASLLPIMIHQCPDNFSTVEYFENLKSKELGRLVIYADILTSSMNVVAGRKLHHGLVVIPRQQTQGQGRRTNLWLSPPGCAMFTMQLHVPVNSELGSRLSILQHLVAVATVSAIKSLPGYENIDLRLKWPNDFYAGSETKIGGLIVSTIMESSIAICNIGIHFIFIFQTNFVSHCLFFHCPYSSII
ncbi:biotin--protein ligase isoform X2 [Venturia canescens]|uniref:biotin--protein ligase isoform X2 n=1 Tax=Venturia canescens TaxID=32260 RepID=UPI001C9C54BD|nr:biotin--protein ligase isoform X2 [Venturia canescens]